MRLSREELLKQYPYWNEKNNDIVKVSLKKIKKMFDQGLGEVAIRKFGTFYIKKKKITCLK